MLHWKEWLGPGRRLLSMFLAVALSLGLRCSPGPRTDRPAPSGTREVAADLTLAALQKSLARAQEQLAALTNLRRPNFPSLPLDMPTTLPGDSAAFAFKSARKRIPRSSGPIAPPSLACWKSGHWRDFYPKTWRSGEVTTHHRNHPLDTILTNSRHDWYTSGV